MTDIVLAVAILLAAFIVVDGLHSIAWALGSVARSIKERDKRNDR